MVEKGVRGAAAQEKEKGFFYFWQGVALCGCLGEWRERVRFLGFFCGLGFFMVSSSLQNPPSFFFLC
jgi:hypothetical protein